MTAPAIGSLWRVRTQVAFTRGVLFDDVRVVAVDAAWVCVEDNSGATRWVPLSLWTHEGVSVRPR